MCLPLSDRASRPAITWPGRWPGCSARLGRQQHRSGPPGGVEAAITVLPPGFRRLMMVTCDGAGASHELVKELNRLASRHGY
jgi:hypothetical protein